MHRSLLPAALMVGAAFAGAAAGQSFPDGSGAPIAPGTDIEGALDGRRLARALFEAARADPKQIASQKLETSRREAWAFLDWQLYAYKKCSVFDPGMMGWSQRLLAAELAVCESSAEKAAAYKRHWQVTWEDEHVAQSKFDAGRGTIADLMAVQYDRLTAEIDWVQARARAGKEKPYPLAESLPEFRFDLSDYEMSPLKVRARARVEVSRADLGELARQRVVAARIAFRGRLVDYDNGKDYLDLVLELADSVTQAELGVLGGKADEASIRERAWEMAWMVHDIKRRQFEAKRTSVEGLDASHYALLHAEIALLRAKQIKRPNRVGSLLNEPVLANFFDAKTFARARAEVGRTDLDDLLRNRQEKARAAYRLRLEGFYSGKIWWIDPLLQRSKRLLESDLALAAGPTGREAAHVRHWKRDWQIEELAQSKFDASRGTLSDLLTARFARLDAELLWAQARQARK